MTDLYQTANLLGQLIIGRRPEWQQITLRTDGAAVPVTRKGAPYAAGSGIGLNNSPKTRVAVDLREDVARYGHRVRVTTVANATTYTITVDGFDYDYLSDADATQAEIVQGLVDAINNGVSLGNISLTFADNAPPTEDTITRGAGDWTADNVGSGTQITLSNGSGAALNEGLTFTASASTAPTATVFTCIVTDDVSAETETYDVIAKQQVSAVAEDRDGDGTIDTVVITTLLGIEQVAVIGPITTNTTSAQDAAIELLASETTVQTVTVSAELEFDKDATTCDVEVYFTAGGKNPQTGWRSPNECQFTSLTYIGLDERINSAGCTRADIAIRNADGIVARAYLGPAVQEATG